MEGALLSGSFLRLPSTHHGCCVPLSKEIEIKCAHSKDYGFQVWHTILSPVISKALECSWARIITLPTALSKSHNLPSKHIGTLGRYRSTSLLLSYGTHQLSQLPHVESKQILLIHLSGLLSKSSHAGIIQLAVDRLIHKSSYGLVLVFSLILFFVPSW